MCYWVLWLQRENYLSEKRVSLQQHGWSWTGMLNLKCGSFSFWTAIFFCIWIQKYTTLHYMHGRDKEIGRLEVGTTLFLPWNPLMHRFLTFCAFSSDHQPWFPSLVCPVSSDQPLLQLETLVPCKVSFITPLKIVLSYVTSRSAKAWFGSDLWTMGWDQKKFLFCSDSAIFGRMLPFFLSNVKLAGGLPDLYY